MGVLLQNDQPVGGISADVIETINFSDLTTTSKTLPGAINELAANPSTTESMSQAEYNALTEAEKMDGTARFVYDAISTDESELWTRVGRNTLHTDAQIISNAINEIKDTMGSGTLTTTSPTIIGGINELNSSLTIEELGTSNILTPVSGVTMNDRACWKIGKFVYLNAVFTISNPTQGINNLATYKTGYAPSSAYLCTVMSYATGNDAGASSLLNLRTNKVDVEHTGGKPYLVISVIYKVA